MKTDILFAVEDPGAANFILDMPDELKGNNLNSIIISFGYAQKFLDERNVNHIKLRDSESLSKILEDFNFKILVAGTSQNLNSRILPLINLCKEKSIITVGIIDMFADSNLRFKGYTDDPLNYATNYLIVPDKFTLDEFVKLGFDKQNIFQIAHPSLQRIRKNSLNYPKEKILKKRNSLLNKRSKNTEIWLFAGELISDNPRFSKDEKYTFFGRGKSTQRIHIILEEVLEIRNKKEIKPFLILRMHPKNKKYDYEPYFKEIDQISDSIDPLEDILCSDLVIGSTTIFLMESFYAGKPTLSIIPKKEEQNWCPSVLNGQTPCAYTTAQIEYELSSYRNKNLKQIKTCNQVSFSSILGKLLKI